MTTDTDNNKLEFYKYLNGNIDLLDIEKFVYSRTDLEQQLDKDIYFELINFNFKDKNANDRLKAFLLTHIVDEGQFETWKLKTLLHNFLTDTDNIKEYLNKLYDLYCGVYQDNGQRKYQYKFLANLGLNFLYWLEEGYLKTNYGDKWKTEYENGLKDLKHYQEQLKPFAIEILTAIDDNKIQILNDGTYLITADLKAQLETDTIYELIHPDKKYSR